MYNFSLFFTLLYNLDDGHSVTRARLKRFRSNINQEFFWCLELAWSWFANNLETAGGNCDIYFIQNLFSSLMKSKLKSMVFPCFMAQSQCIFSSHYNRHFLLIILNIYSTLWKQYIFHEISKGHIKCRVIYRLVSQIFRILFGNITKEIVLRPAPFSDVLTYPVCSITSYIE